MSHQCHTPRSTHLALLEIQHRLITNNSTKFKPFHGMHDIPCLQTLARLRKLRFVVGETKKNFFGPLNSWSWQFAYILYDWHLYLYPTDTNTLYKSKPNITNNTHFFLVTISMHTTAELRHRTQTVWTALQLTTSTRQKAHAELSFLWTLRCSLPGVRSEGEIEDVFRREVWIM
jgi:hypothetical protein